MSNAMLISVGGSPQPILKSISHYRPSFVSFLVSQQTSQVAISIVNELKNLGIEFQYEQSICENPEDLLDCYNVAEKAVLRILNKGYKASDIVVDYTGGTKNMSVAISLASIKYGSSYTYIGGKERTKDGVGIVIDGKEEVYHSLNPWDFLAINEKENIATLFNTYQFKSAKEIADSVSNKTTRYKSLFRKIGLIIEGFYKWDLFCHEDALRMFDRAKADELAHEYDERWMKDFAQNVLNAIERLKGLVKDSGKPTKAMICDLFSNAERRFEEGKIDDAILRLYRIVEMIAQMRLSQIYNIDVSDVKLEQLPDSMKDSFKAKYLDMQDNKIKLPQNAAFTLLKELGDDVGKVFVANEKKFKSIQHSRNYSYLAHGFQSSSDKTYISLKDFILSLGIINDTDIWRFPKI